jgi:hypothetical protein
LKKSTTYFSIILILSVASVPLLSTATSQTQSIKVLSYTYYVDSLGYFIVVGEVQNQGPNTIRRIILTGTIIDSNGAQASSYGPVWGEYLTPQQKAPFYMEFPSRADDGSVITEISEIKIDVYMAEPTPNYRYPYLTIANDQSFIGTNRGSPTTSTNLSDGDFGVFWVTGNLQNTGTRTANDVAIYATFYNSKNEPVAVGYSAKINQIAPSQTTSIKLGAFDLNQSIVPEDKKITTYSLLIQAQGPILEGDPPIQGTTPTPPQILNNTPVGTNNGNDPSESLDNNGHSSIEIYVIAGVIVTVTIALTILIIRRRTGLKQN